MTTYVVVKYNLYAMYLLVYLLLLLQHLHAMSRLHILALDNQASKSLALILLQNYKIIHYKENGDVLKRKLQCIKTSRSGQEDSGEGCATATLIWGINEMHFDFMPGKRTIDAIFIIHQVQEKYMAVTNEIKLRLIQNLPENQANTGQLKSNLLIAVDMIYDISQLRCCRWAYKWTYMCSKTHWIQNFSVQTCYYLGSF